jgi:hypothetical protein
MLVVIAAGAVLAACHSSSGALTGAQTPDAAVSQFLSAARAQDLQAMSVIWGTAKGAARDVIKSRSELEQREIILTCFFNVDKSRLLDHYQGEGGRQIYHVELTKGDMVRQTNFYTIEGPSARWYVESADLKPVQGFCSQG